MVEFKFLVGYFLIWWSGATVTYLVNVADAKRRDKTSLSKITHESYRTHLIWFFVPAVALLFVLYGILLMIPSRGWWF